MTKAPAFPAGVKVRKPKGAVITGLPLPTAQALAEAALIFDEAPPPEKAARAKRRPAAKRKAKPAARRKAARCKPATTPKTRPAAPPAEIDDRSPVSPLPRDRALAPPSAKGFVARMVRWLDAISFVVAGQPLKRRRRAALPRSPQVLPQPQAQRRAPPSRKPDPTGGEAGAELARLRAENARLRAELARVGARGQGLARG